MRIKIYWKSLALLQSETAAKSIGMNMKGLFYPNMRMGRALKESINETMSRIEITYTANTIKGQTELLDDEFLMQSTIDLGNAFQALNEVKGVCWHLTMKDLFEGLQHSARTQ